MPLTPEEKKLITFEGFEAAFQKQIAFSNTYQEAYEKTEELVNDAIGQRLFPNYDSFRKQQSRRMGQRKEQREKESRMKRYLRGR